VAGPKACTKQMMTCSMSGSPRPASCCCASRGAMGLACLAGQFWPGSRETPRLCIKTISSGHAAHSNLNLTRPRPSSSRRRPPGGFCSGLTFSGLSALTAVCPCSDAAAAIRRGQDSHGFFSRQRQAGDAEEIPHPWRRPFVGSRPRGAVIEWAATSEPRPPTRTANLEHRLLHSRPLPVASHLLCLSCSLATRLLRLAG
jgi:hypothetical protein